MGNAIKKTGEVIGKSAGSNPYVTLINTGLEFGKEALKYINEMQGQISEMNKTQLDDHDRKIMVYQDQLEELKTLINTPDLSFEEKRKIIDEMGEIREKINLELDRRIELSNAEKEKKREEKRKAGRFAAEVLTGVIPFTTAYRAMKSKKEKKKASITVEDDSTEDNVQIENNKQIETK